MHTCALTPAPPPPQHPLPQGNSSIIVVDEGQLNKFKKRFAGLGELSQVSAAASTPGPSKEELKKAAAAGKAGAKGKGKGRR